MGYARIRGSLISRVGQPVRFGAPNPLELILILLCQRRKRPQITNLPVPQQRTSTPSSYRERSSGSLYFVWHAMPEVQPDGHEPLQVLGASGLANVSNVLSV
jgi:hypothetical protein